MAVDLGQILRLMIDKNYSRLNCEVGAPPSLLIKGDGRPLNLPPLTPEDTFKWMRAIAPESSQRQYAERGECEFEYAFDETARFLVKAFRYKGNCCFRVRRGRAS